MNNCLNLFVMFTLFIYSIASFIQKFLQTLHNQIYIDLLNILYIFTKNNVDFNWIIINFNLSFYGLLSITNLLGIYFSFIFIFHIIYSYSFLGAPRSCYLVNLSIWFKVYFNHMSIIINIVKLFKLLSIIIGISLQNVNDISELKWIQRFHLDNGIVKSITIIYNLLLTSIYLVFIGFLLSSILVLMDSIFNYIDFCTINIFIIIVIDKICMMPGIYFYILFFTIYYDIFAFTSFLSTIDYEFYNILSIFYIIYILFIWMFLIRISNIYYFFIFPFISLFLTLLIYLVNLVFISSIVNSCFAFIFLGIGSILLLDIINIHVDLYWITNIYISLFISFYLHIQDNLNISLVVIMDQDLHFLLFVILVNIFLSLIMFYGISIISLVNNMSINTFHLIYNKFLYNMSNKLLGNNFTYKFISNTIFHNISIIINIIHIIISGVTYNYLLFLTITMVYLFRVISFMIGFYNYESIYNVLQILLILLIVLSLSSLLTVLERKGLASSQRRLGPSYNGWFGLVQILMDGIKLVYKDYHRYNHIHNKYIIVSCILNFVFSYLLFIFIYIDLILYINLSFLLLFFILILMINHITIIICGILINNSKWTILSSIRLILLFFMYDIIFTLILLYLSPNIAFHFYYSNNLINLNQYIDTQSYHINLLKYPFLFFIYLFLVLIEAGRIPVDLIESESELISGYTIEYSGFLYALFASAEYSIILFHSILLSILFLSYYNFYLLYLHVTLIFFFFLIIRSTLPRFQYTHLFRASFHSLLPITLLFFIIG